MKKMISFVVSVIGIVGIIGVLAWFGSKNQTNTNNQSNHNASTALVSAEKSFDFSTISMAKGKVSHRFEIKNSSDQPVTIKGMSTTCMCTEANLYYKQEKHGPFGMTGMSNPSVKTTIQPGDKAEVEAIFDPAAHGPAGVGPVSREVSVETNSGMLIFGISANVTP